MFDWVLDIPLKFVINLLNHDMASLVIVDNEKVKISSTITSVK